LFQNYVKETPSNKNDNTKGQSQKNYKLYNGYKKNCLLSQSISQVQAINPIYCENPQVYIEQWLEMLYQDINTSVELKTWLEIKRNDADLQNIQYNIFTLKQ
jgi:hypothetical protein